MDFLLYTFVAFVAVFGVVGLVLSVSNLMDLP